MEFLGALNRLVGAAHHDVVDLDVGRGGEHVQGAGGDGLGGEHLDALPGLLELVFAASKIFV